MRINIALKYVIRMQARARQKLAIVHVARERRDATRAAVVLQAFWRMRLRREEFQREKMGMRLRQLRGGLILINHAKRRIFRRIAPDT